MLANFNTLPQSASLKILPPADLIEKSRPAVQLFRRKRDYSSKKGEKPQVTFLEQTDEKLPDFVPPVTLPEALSQMRNTLGKYKAVCSQLNLKCKEQGGEILRLQRLLQENGIKF